MTKTYSPELLIELRAAVAEHVMGWKRVLHTHELDVSKFIVRADGVVRARWPDAFTGIDWQPDIDPAQAFAVLKRCIEGRGTIGVSRFDAENFMCGKLLLDPVDAIVGKAPSLELAIVIFALRFHKPDHPVLKKLK